MAEIERRRQAQGSAHRGHVFDEATTEYMNMDAEQRKTSQIEDLKQMIEEIKNDSDEEDDELKNRMNAVDLEDEEALEKLLEEVEYFEGRN